MPDMCMTCQHEEGFHLDGKWECYAQVVGKSGRTSGCPCSRFVDRMRPSYKHEHDPSRRMVLGL